MWIFLHKVNTTTANNNNKGFSLNTKPIKTQQNEKRRNIDLKKVSAFHVDCKTVFHSTKIYKAPLRKAKTRHLRDDELFTSFNAVIDSCE